MTTNRILSGFLPLVLTPTVIALGCGGGGDDSSNNGDDGGAERDGGDQDGGGAVCGNGNVP